VHRQVLAPAERAADAGRFDHDLLRRQPERLGELLVVQVHPLGGHVQLHAVLGRHRQPRLGREEARVLHADRVLAAHHHVRVGQRALLRVAAPDPLAGHQVPVGLDRGRAGFERGEGIGDRRQDLVADRDPAGGQQRGGLVGGGHHRDRFAVEAHDVHGQHGLVHLHLAEELAAGDVLGGEDVEHAGHTPRRRGVDRDDPGVGVRAAHRHRPHGVLGGDVGRVPELAENLGQVVGLGHVLADAHVASFPRCAASRTASRMCW
jgi:hypothetical protein